MSFADNTFDAVYAIEATVHAPSLEGIYSEIFRVLKPGGTFGVYEWLMTDAYDNTNPHHREIRLGIEQGDGISNMEKIDVALAAVKAAGFEMVLNEDLADAEHEAKDYAPWYWPLSGQLKHIGSLMDFFTVVRMTHVARWTIHRVLGAGETVGLIPRGTAKTADSLAVAADCLVAGGREKLFTPMYLMVAVSFCLLSCFIMLWVGIMLMRTIEKTRGMNSAMRKTSLMLHLHLVYSNTNLVRRYKSMHGT